ncbi:transposase [Tsukamurella sp. DT100]|uniref:transposase n=1 Tax=Tsukamurella sp. DT100 TaxID=3393415 RepID=UPI003CEB1D7C
MAGPLGGDREPAGHGIGSPRGGLTTKIHAAVDGQGRPLAVADRAYTSGVNRRMIASRGIKAVLSQKVTEIDARRRKGAAGGRPPTFDAEIYKGRKVVERSFNDTKQWCGLATRYDKLAITYRAGVMLQACLRWLRLLRDPPWPHLSRATALPDQRNRTFRGVPGAECGAVASAGLSSEQMVRDEFELDFRCPFEDLG